MTTDIYDTATHADPSNIAAREDFHRTSVMSPMVQGVISGFGIDGCRLGLEAIGRR
ncbi:MAG: type II 3-dehydroquinate dehydratase [Actinomycetota bacterium]|nr:type II 3-dehydroquinate dehydratase [Actinomycetota bacterium]